jgi:hypothetical protein
MHVIYVLLFITLMQCGVRAVTWRRQLVAGLSTPRIGSHPKSIPAVFVLDKLTWNTFFSEFFGFSLTELFHAGHDKKYNCELYEIFNEPNIVNYIKVKRLAWAGHLVCMNNDRTSMGRGLGVYEQ